MRKHFRKAKAVAFVLAALMAVTVCFTACGQGPQGDKGEVGAPGAAGAAGVAGQNGQSPTIGKNGNWWIGDKDTGVYAGFPTTSTTGADIVEQEVSPNGTMTGQLDAKGKFYADYASHDEAHKAGRDVNIRIGEEGFVLLKNENNALPLSKAERKVTTLGRRSTNLQLGGSGSGSGTPGSATDAYYKVPVSTLKSSLLGAGFSVNERVHKFYESLGTTDTAEINPDVYLTKSLIETYQAYNDAAIIVISRPGMEGGDLAIKNVAGHKDPNEHQLQLDDNERATVAHAKKYFKKVIVLINSSSTMQLDELNDTKTSTNLGVDAIIHVGHVGNDAIDAVGRILTGEVNPSGRTVDLWADDFNKIPAVSNFGDYTHVGLDNNFYRADGTMLTYSGVEYREGVYVGYRYFETVRDDMNSAKAGEGDKWYAENVDYPFGYGLSYTTFDWSLDNVKSEAAIEKANSTVTIRVKVTNTGKYAGKDVVEIYANAPYTNGGIEKPSQVLVGFAKTKLLKPGESDVVTIQFVAQDMASFDYNDANSNDFYGYELEKGTYIISARRNSNTSVLQVKRTVAETIKCDKDYTTGATIDNVLSKAEGMWAAYNTEGGTLADNYLSRGDMTALPDPASKEDRTITTAKEQILEKQAHDKNKGLSFEDKTTDPWYVKSAPTGWSQATEHQANNSDIKIKLKDMAGLSYTEMSIKDGVVTLGDTEADEQWQKFLNQFTWEELLMLIEGGKLADNLMNDELMKFGVGQFLQQDGPMQLKGNTNYIYAVQRAKCAAEGGLGFVDNTDAAAKDWGYSRAGTTNPKFAANKDEHLVIKNKIDAMRGTYFAGNVVIASTWNVELIEEQGRVYGNDSIFLGVPGVYAPSMNLHRTPFGGRNFEYYSEDGVLAGKIAAAHVRGCVSKGAIVFIKHLFLNDQEYDRSISGGVSTYVTEQAAREIYLKPFELAIKEGHANGIMAAFNRIGDVPAATNTALFEQILRREFGFKGYAMTDAWTDALYIHTDAIVRGALDAALRWMTPNNIEHGKYENGKVYMSSDGTRADAKNTMESPTQWAMVRRAAQHILYAFANSHDIKNGVEDGMTITVKYTNGMAANTQVFATALGTTVITDLTVKESDKAALKDAGLAISKYGVLTGTAKGACEFEVSYQYDDLGITSTATIKVEIVPDVEVEKIAEMKVGTAASGVKFTSLRYTAGQAIAAEISGLAHGENETCGTAYGEIDKVEYSLAQGSTNTLPAGLTLNKDGTVTGTPSAAVENKEVIIRVDSYGFVYGTKSSFTGTKYASQTNFFKFKFTVGANGSSCTFVEEVKGSDTVTLKREFDKKFTAWDYNYKSSSVEFVINTVLLADEKAANRDVVLVAKAASNTNRRSFVAYLTLKADGSFKITNAKVTLIPGSDEQTITGKWTITNGKVVFSEVTAAPAKDEVPFDLGRTTKDADGDVTNWTSMLA